MNPFLVVRATIARHRGTYALFIALVAVATAIGVAITTQEAALRIARQIADYAAAQCEHRALPIHSGRGHRVEHALVSRQ